MSGAIGHRSARFRRSAFCSARRDGSGSTATPVRIVRRRRSRPLLSDASTPRATSCGGERVARPAAHTAQRRLFQAGPIASSARRPSPRPADALAPRRNCRRMRTSRRRARVAPGVPVNSYNREIACCHLQPGPEIGDEERGLCRAVAVIVVVKVAARGVVEQMIAGACRRRGDAEGGSCPGR